MSVVLGYDARAATGATSPLHQAEYRTRYLLKHDVEMVCSADPDIWIRGCHPRTWIDVLKASNREPAQLVRLGDLGGLWFDLNELKKLSTELCVDCSFVRLIGVDDRLRVGNDRVKATEQRWRHKGFDVVNVDLLSGLSNCGFTEVSEKKSTVDAFAGMINEFHLFTQREAAIRYAQVCSERVGEHAPFYAIGVEEDLNGVDH